MRVGRAEQSRSPRLASPRLDVVWVSSFPDASDPTPRPEGTGHGISARGTWLHRSPPGRRRGRVSVEGGNGAGIRDRQDPRPGCGCPPVGSAQAVRQSATRPRPAFRPWFSSVLSMLGAPAWWGPGADTGGWFPVPRRCSAWPAAHGPGMLLAAGTLQRTVERGASERRLGVFPGGIPPFALGRVATTYTDPCINNPVLVQLFARRG